MTWIWLSSFNHLSFKPNFMLLYLGKSAFYLLPYTHGQNKLFSCNQNILCITPQGNLIWQNQLTTFSESILISNLGTFNSHAIFKPWQTAQIPRLDMNPLNQTPWSSLMRPPARPTLRLSHASISIKHRPTCWREFPFNHLFHVNSTPPFLLEEAFVISRTLARTQRNLKSFVTRFPSKTNSLRQIQHHQTIYSRKSYMPIIKKETGCFTIQIPHQPTP